MQVLSQGVLQKKRTDRRTADRKHCGGVHEQRPPRLPGLSHLWWYQ